MISLAGGADTLIFRSGFALTSLNTVGTLHANGGAGIDELRIFSGVNQEIRDGEFINFETVVHNGGGNQLSLIDTDNNRSTFTLDASLAGSFTANNGEVNLSNTDASLRAGTVTFQADSTLSGVGEVVGNTTVFGLHDPGNSVGAMTMTGTLTLASNSTTRIEFDEGGDGGTNITAADRGTEFDAVDVTGDLTVQAGARFVIDVLDATPATDLADLIAQVTGGTPALFPIYEVTGTLTVAPFSSLNLIPTGGSNIAGTQWQFYTSLGPTSVFGVQLVLDVPEPGTLAVLGAGLIGIAGARRRQNSLRSSTHTLRGE